MPTSSPLVYESLFSEFASFCKISPEFELIQTTWAGHLKNIVLYISIETQNLDKAQALGALLAVAALYFKFYIRFT